MLPIIGTMGSFMQRTKLEMKWNQKKQNPMMQKEENIDPQIRQFQENMASAKKNSTIMGIDSKLKSGSKITADELEYLRTNCPELYKKALEVMREREEYRKELERCRTKEEVQRLNTNRMNQYLSQAKAVSSNPNIPLSNKTEVLDQITRKMMGVKSEHMAFIKEFRYQQLPTEEELRNKEKNKRKKIPDSNIQEESQELPKYFSEKKAEQSQLEELLNGEKDKEENSKAKAFDNGKNKKADRLNSAQRLLAPEVKSVPMSSEIHVSSAITQSDAVSSPDAPNPVPVFVPASRPKISLKA